MGIARRVARVSAIRASHDLAPDSTVLSLILNVYLFRLGMGQIFYGPVADRFGRKPTVLIGLGTFAVVARHLRVRRRASLSRP